MFESDGYTHCTISNVSTWTKGGRRSRDGTLSFTQHGGEILMTLRHGQAEKVGSFKFPKRELGRLRQMFDEYCRDASFKPTSTTQFIVINRNKISNDMRIRFPSGAEAIPLQKDVEKALDLMRKPLTELDLQYPEISLWADLIASNNPELLWSLVFRSGSDQSLHLGRIYGPNITPEQLTAFQQIIGLPEDSVIRTNGEWTEYLRGSSLPAQLLDIRTYDHPADNFLLSMMGHRIIMRAFLNGTEVPKDEMTSSNKSNLGSVFVFLEDTQVDQGNAKVSFDEMPLVEVYIEPKLDGPYVHPAFDGKTPLALTKNQKTRKILGLGRGDKVMCPSCFKPNSDCWEIDPAEQVYVMKADTKEEFQYAFQAPGLLGSDGTAQFIPWTPMVIGRTVSGARWPREILSLELDGEDIASAICGVAVENDSVLKVVLRRDL